MSETEPAVSIRGVSKRYALYQRPGDRLRELLSPTRSRLHEERWALHDVSLEVPRGATWGIVGKNGAGKSTLLKIVAGKLRPTRGEVQVRGRVSSILELGTGFQEHLTGRQNAKVNALFLGHDPWLVDQHLGAILEFAGVGAYADQPLHTYSSGMKARLAFSVLTSLRPEILILDEALATGDAGFAEKCQRFLRSLCTSGCTTLVTGHDLSFLSEACQHLVWLDEGVVRAAGAPAQVVPSYLESVGLHLDAVDRPKRVLLRIAPTSSDPAPAFDFHCLEWVGPAGEVLAAHFLGDAPTFAHLIVGTQECGMTPGVAGGGWAREVDTHSNGSTSRVLRPLDGPGGLAYLAAPLPQFPQPLPVALRIAGRHALAAPLRLSALLEGEWRELGEFGTGLRDGIPWYRAELALPRREPASGRGLA